MNNICICATLYHHDEDIKILTLFKKLKIEKNNFDVTPRCKIYVNDKSVSLYLIIINGKIF